MTAALEKALKDLTTPTTIRVQPVAPEQEKWTDTLGDVLGQLMILALYAWFVGLGTAVAHGYWPGVPEVGYWQAVALLLGLSAVGHAVRGPAWKWARR